MAAPALHFDEKSRSVEASSDSNVEVGRKGTDDSILKASGATIDVKASKRAQRKMDSIILPLFVIAYFLSFLDRGNIGNARVAGLQKDLGLTNKQYSIALTVTFIPFILTEIPYALIMRKVGAHIALPLMISLWGLVTACHGSVRSYGGLIACRWFLGMCEGGILPLIILYMSSVYKRHHLQIRVSFITASTALAGAFSGLLAAAIQQIEARGLPGWSWIFIIEGAITSFFGVLVYFIVPENIDRAWFLTPEEKVAYRQDIEQDWSGDLEHEPFSIYEILKAFRSPHVLFICIPLFLNGASLYGLAYFAPTIVSALGNSPTRTQLLSVPPFACAWVAAIGASYFADKYHQRGITAIVGNLIAMVGYIIFHVTPGRHADYAALCLQVTGIYMTPPCFASWVANNVQPHYRRATAIGLAFIFTNSGGILSTWIFNDPPRFAFATRLNLAFTVVTIVTTGLLSLYLAMRNREKERMIARGDVDMSVEARLRLGDTHPYFKYTT